MPPTARKPPQDNGELQIDVALAYQERTWRLQRIGWGVFIALIIAALAGLFGAGPLSSTRAGTPTDGLQVEYERIARLNAPTTIVVRADRRLARGDELGVTLSGDMVRGLAMESSMPPADGATVLPDGVVLRFKAGRQPGELTIVLQAKPQRVGRLSSGIGVAGGPAHTIRQWIHP